MKSNKRLLVDELGTFNFNLRYISIIDRMKPLQLANNLWLEEKYKKMENEIKKGIQDSKQS